MASGSQSNGGPGVMPQAPQALAVRLDVRRELPRERLRPNESACWQSGEFRAAFLTCAARAGLRQRPPFSSRAVADPRRPATKKAPAPLPRPARQDRRSGLSDTLNPRRRPGAWNGSSGSFSAAVWELRRDRGGASCGLRSLPQERMAGQPQRRSQQQRKARSGAASSERRLAGHWTRARRSAQPITAKSANFFNRRAREGCRRTACAIDVTGCAVPADHPDMPPGLRPCRRRG